MADIIAKLQAFVTHPEVDSMTPVWSLSQDDAKEILELLGERLKKIDLSFKQIKEAAQRGRY